jgi:hypothetical protein
MRTMRSSRGVSEGLCADSEEVRDPASDINSALADRLKVLDPMYGPAD